MEWHKSVRPLLLTALLASACGSPAQKEPTPKPIEAGPAGSGKSAALPAGAKAMQAADVSSLMTVARRELPAPSPGEYRVSGEQRFNGWFLSAEKVVFEADAKLVFTQAAIRSRANLFVLAKEITSLDQQKPGQIVWETPAPVGAPGQAGSAATGANHNQTEGVPGGRGSDGLPGAAGARGDDAPSLTLITLAFRNPLFVNLVGTIGGLGAQGQHGGQGGTGGFGNSASQNAFNCNRGAGNGAPGGQGGNGGNGGTGGTGGNGGTFTLIVPNDQTGMASRLLKVDLSAGDGGSGGNGGNPGAGGPGGAGGAQQLPYCRGEGGSGATGSAGQAGARGDSGGKGRVGDYFVGNITPAVFDEFAGKR